MFILMDVNKILIRWTGIDGRTNRGNHISFRDDNTKPFSLGLKENDEAIVYYMENVIKPTVIKMV